MTQKRRENEHKWRGKSVLKHEMCENEQEKKLDGFPILITDSLSTQT